MTRIDFYILSETTDMVMTVCRLCDKAVGSSARVYLRSVEAKMTDEIDGALWSFRQGGFLSHERYLGQPSNDPQPALLIGDGEPPVSHHGILLNLAADVPLYFSHFERVLEVVPADQTERLQSRERYKFYRDRGYELKTTNL